MNNEKKLKEDIISIGQLLWDKDLASGLNGNISARVEGETILLTGHGTCLGRLEEHEILRMKLSGEMLEKGSVSTEKLLHTEIYKNFPDVTAIVHTHTTYTNGYFLENDVLSPRIFEAKMVLGEITAVPQYTPAVTDAGPVIEALKKNNIVVLKNHGVVAVGRKHFDCFLWIQALEEAVKVDVISKLYSGSQGHKVTKSQDTLPASRDMLHETKKYKLFSQDQIDEIVNLVNADAPLKDLGEKTKMTMDLAVQLNETGKVYSFSFENGRIAKVGNDGNAEFLISAPENIWKAVFNREIDPFVATTQKKMNLRGDFAKISKWYAPCSRIFEIWAKVPVE